MIRAGIDNRIQIAGPAGPLEGLFECPARGSSTVPVVAVVCHPHPLHGGTMENKVAHTLSRCFTRMGGEALRFNFRGVGASAGRHDDGRGEVDDVVAAAKWVSGHRPGSSLFLAGFSFGAGAALVAAMRLKPAGVVAVAPPVGRMPADFTWPDCPVLVVHGEQDELVSVDDVRAWVDRSDRHPELAVIAGASHFFHRALGALAAAVEPFLERVGNVQSAHATGATGAARSASGDPSC